MSYGEPQDLDGRCNARLFIGDNYGDNHATFRCQLDPGHDGPHREEYNAHRGGQIVVTWERDERAHCDHEHERSTSDCPLDAEEHDATTCPICKR